MAALLFLLAFAAIMVLYTLTLYKTMTAVAPPNRTMEPGLIWLNMIPFLNLVWHFVIVDKLANSIANEFRQRVGQSDFKPGYGIGMIASGSFALSTVISILTRETTPVSMIIGLFSLLGMICGTVYWILIYRYQRRIKNLPPYIADSAIFNHPSPDSI